MIIYTSELSVMFKKNASNHDLIKQMDSNKVSPPDQKNECKGCLKRRDISDAFDRNKAEKIWYLRRGLKFFLRYNADVVHKATLKILLCCQLIELFFLHFIV